MGLSMVADKELVTGARVGEVPSGSGVIDRRS